jgi:hypothetical protein
MEYEANPATALPGSRGHGPPVGLFRVAFAHP